MIADDEYEPGRGGDDMLAAEYVLGVLSAEERQDAARRIERDADFARLVEGWEERLSPLNVHYPDVEPPASVREKLETRLFADPPPRTATTALGRGLAFWRGLALVSMAALVAVAVWTAASIFQPTSPERLVASLASEESDVRYLVVYDGAAGEISMSHVTGERAPDRDFELWLIAGNEVMSLGVVPAGATAHMPVVPEMRGRIEPGAQFAISVEPSGGSPTGSPTGPVVAAGDLRTI